MHIHKLSRPYIEAQYPQLLSRLHLSVAYPQFDEQVTVQEKHLLRLPFSAHPQTGKICVPLDVATIDTCDPFSIPTARLASTAGFPVHVLAIYMSSTYVNMPCTGRCVLP